MISLWFRLEFAFEVVWVPEMPEPEAFLEAKPLDEPPLEPCRAV